MWWSWNKGTTESQKPADLEPCDGFFQGLDLSVWVHLGYQVLKLDGEEFVIHLFCQYDDMNKRTYRIQGTEYRKKLIEDHHLYMHKYIQPQAMGSEEVYHYNHNPSRWLKDYMAETYRVSWSTGVS